MLIVLSLVISNAVSCTLVEVVTMVCDLGLAGI